MQSLMQAPAAGLIYLGNGFKQWSEWSALMQISAAPRADVGADNHGKLWKSPIVDLD
jgi:hypothetical protein